MISECTIFAAVVESQVGGSIHMWKTATHLSVSINHTQFQAVTKEKTQTTTAATPYTTETSYRSIH